MFSKIKCDTFGRFGNMEIYGDSFVHRTNVLLIGIGVGIEIRMLCIHFRIPFSLHIRVLRRSLSTLLTLGSHPQKFQSNGKKPLSYLNVI